MKKKLYILFTLLTFCLNSSEIFADHVKAAFDVGSGQTKVTIAVIDDHTGRPTKILFAEETPILLGHDLKQSKDGMLSAKILAVAEKVINEYRNLALQHGAVEMAGVATAVFRESKNGADFIAKVRSEMGIDLRLITQKEEGRIGFLTAVASSGKAAEQVIAWDTGGASFQISAEKNADELLVYQGAWGASKVLAAMVEEVQGKDFSKIHTANPATIDHVIALQKIVLKSLKTPSIELLNKFKNPGITVVGVGGPFSIYRMAEIAHGRREYTKEDVWAAIEKLAGSSNEDLAATYPEPEMVIPRLTLLYTIMDFFEIKKVLYTPTTGNTLGILISPQFWGAKSSS